MDTRTTRTPATVRAARWSASHPWRAIGMWLAFVAMAVSLSALIAPKEASMDEEGSGPSGRAHAMLDAAGMIGPASEHVLVTSPGGGPLDTAAVTAALDEVAQDMRRLDEVAGVGDVVIAPSGDAAMLSIEVAGDRTDAADQIGAMHDVTAAVASGYPSLHIEQIGGATLDEAIMGIVEDDLASAEALSLPVTLAIMLLAFGALIAAAIPVLLALSAVISSFGLYAVVSHLVPDTGSVANMILLIGMAVGVDYSLFFVKRQREEREKGHGSVDAVEIAARTAGHSILVSGIAVIVSVSGLFLVGNVIFSGLAVGAILVVAVAMLGSLTVVPALVGKLGRWVDRPRIPLLWRVLRRARPGAVSGRLVAPVLRRPALALAVSSVVMVGLAVPALTMKLGDTGLEQLPQDDPAVAAMVRLHEEFSSEGTSVSVVARADDATAVSQLGVALAELQRAAVASGAVVETDDALAVSDDGRTFELVLSTPYADGSTESIDVLHAVRDTFAPAALDGIAGIEWATGGDEAETVDFADQQSRALPLVVGFVLVFTLLMMGFTFRSVGIAAITLVLNLASVAAAFGVLALVFQGGWAEGILDFTSNGAVVAWIPLFLFVVLVGLSMDYHVLVLSRIREAARSGSDPLHAIATGVRQTAGPVSMAALVMVSVFGLFATASIADMKQMGIGLAAAILIDATIVRIVMLPAMLAIWSGVVTTMARRGGAGDHDAPGRGLSAVDRSAGRPGVDRAPGRDGDAATTPSRAPASPTPRTPPRPVAPVSSPLR